MVRPKKARLESNESTWKVSINEILIQGLDSKHLWKLLFLLSLSHCLIFLSHYTL
jgi:hypothetical protein